VIRRVVVVFEMLLEEVFSVVVTIRGADGGVSMLRCGSFGSPNVSTLPLAVIPLNGSAIAFFSISAK
jgi:hypothetical protein